MFTWSYKYSMDVDLPLKTAWNFYTNPTNWPKWEDRLVVRDKNSWRFFQRQSCLKLAIVKWVV